MHSNIHQEGGAYTNSSSMLCKAKYNHTTRLKNTFYPRVIDALSQTKITWTLCNVATLCYWVLSNETEHHYESKFAQITYIKWAYFLAKDIYLMELLSFLEYHLHSIGEVMNLLGCIKLTKRHAKDCLLL